MLTTVVRWRHSMLRGARILTRGEPRDSNRNRASSSTCADCAACSISSFPSRNRAWFGRHPPRGYETGTRLGTGGHSRVRATAGVASGHTSSNDEVRTPENFPRQAPTIASLARPRPPRSREGANVSFATAELTALRPTSGFDARRPSSSGGVATQPSPLTNRLSLHERGSKELGDGLVDLNPRDTQITPYGRGTAA